MLQYNIIPIAITQVNWEKFIHFYKECVGESPTRGLDNQKIPLKDPASFCASLGFDDNPLNTLRGSRDSENAKKHASFSVITNIDTELLIQILKYTELKCATKKAQAGILVVISGNILEWRDAIVAGCKEYSVFNLRVFMNQCHGILSSSKYREIFYNYSQVKCYKGDGTFILKHQ